MQIFNSVVNNNGSSDWKSLMNAVEARVNEELNHRCVRTFNVTEVQSLLLFCFTLLSCEYNSY